MTAFFPKDQQQDFLFCFCYNCDFLVLLWFINSWAKHLREYQLDTRDVWQSSTMNFSHSHWLFSTKYTDSSNVILTIVFLENAYDNVFWGYYVPHDCELYLFFRGEAQLHRIFSKLPVDDKPCVRVIYIQYISKQFQTCIWCNCRHREHSHCPLPVL